MKKICKKCGKEKTKYEYPKGTRYKCRPCEREEQKVHYQRHAERLRPKKAEWMAKARKDPKRRGSILESQRKAWKKSGYQKRKDWMEKLKTGEPWRWKTFTIHTSFRGKLNAKDLEGLWWKQSGLCGLTGQPLDFETAQLDHIIPRCRGGGNVIENVRWVSKEANEAKGGMLDEEFLALCQQVAEWLGRRIMEFEGVK